MPRKVEREAIRAAYEQDYFQTPRATTLVELAGQFDVSDTAVSNSLRRSHERILEPVVAAIDELDDAEGE